MFVHEVKRYLPIFLSLLSLCAIVGTGITFLPSEYIFVFDNYQGRTINVLNAMKLRFQNEILITLVAWLLPIPLAIFIPLWVLEFMLSVSAAVLGVLGISSFFIYEERLNFINMLETVPELGYMWYETVVISLSTFIMFPTKFWLLLGGPMVCVCVGPNYIKEKNFRFSYIFVFISLLSIIFVLPTADRFINENGEFFLIGYSTNSLYGNVLGVGMIHVWVKSYHLVCRDCYQTFVKYSSKYYRILAILWVIIGTALVELWVSSAYALHFAYIILLDLQEENSFWNVILNYRSKAKKLYFKK
mgnify:CR=1 FL=1